jgi:hypothetical protein
MPQAQMIPDIISVLDVPKGRSFGSRYPLQPNSFPKAGIALMNGAIVMVTIITTRITAVGLISSSILYP